VMKIPSFWICQLFSFGSSQGLTLTRQALYHLRHSARSFFMLDIFERGSCDYFPRLALNLNPPDLCLLSSYVYRREPPAPDRFVSFLNFSFFCNVFPI
jgi:hypothetical protein